MVHRESLKKKKKKKETDKDQTHFQTFLGVSFVRLLLIFVLHDKHFAKFVHLVAVGGF